MMLTIAVPMPPSRWSARTGWLGLLLLLAVSGAPAAGRAPEQYAAELQRAQALVQDNHIEQAMGVLSGLTAKHPERVEAFNNLAVLYARQGQLERARDLLASAMNTHPSYAVTYRNLTEVLAQLAAKAYDAALDTRSENRPPPRLALIDGAAGQLGPTPASVVMAAPPAASAPAASAPAASAPAASAPAAPPTPAPIPTAAAAVAGAGAARPVAPASAPAMAEGRIDEVLATVRGWARAWSEQKVRAYLEYYDSSFRPSGGLTRARWAEQRQLRLSRPAFIEVEVRRPEVTFEASGEAVVRFAQRYRSNTLRSDVTKVLRLVKRGEHWRILEERV